MKPREPEWGLSPFCDSVAFGIDVADILLRFERGVGVCPAIVLDVCFHEALRYECADLTNEMRMGGL